jgi:hypothetical protein
MPAPLYVGYSSINNNGLNTTLTDIELIKQDIRNSILISIRSVPGYPRYGSVIPLLPFELDSPTSGITGVLVQNVTKQIKQEPRVSINNISLIRSDDTHSLTLNISLNFVQYNMNDSLVINFSTENR